MSAQISPQKSPEAVEIFDESRYLNGDYAPMRKASFTRDDEHWPRLLALKDSLDSVTLDVLEWAQTRRRATEYCGTHRYTANLTDMTQLLPIEFYDAGAIDLSITKRTCPG